MLPKLHRSVASHRSGFLRIIKHSVVIVSLTDDYFVPCCHVTAGRPLDVMCNRCTTLSVCRLILFQCYKRVCKTVSQITYTVLVETLNPAQSINYVPVLLSWNYWVGDTHFPALPHVPYPLLPSFSRPYPPCWSVTTQKIQHCSLCGLAHFEMSETDVFMNSFVKLKYCKLFILSEMYGVDGDLCI